MILQSDPLFAGHATSRTVRGTHGLFIPKLISDKLALENHDSDTGELAEEEEAPVKDYSEERAKAAKWMYDRKNRPVEWWRWTVLTERNNDPETLRLDDKTAFLIFADLVHAGLLVPTIGSDGQEAYTIHDGKDEAWSRVMSPWRYWLADQVWVVFFSLISGVAGGVIGICLGLWWDQILGKQTP